MNGAVLAILAVIGSCSWIGVLIAAYMNRDKVAADRRKVNAEASEIFNKIALETAQANQETVREIRAEKAEIKEDNQRLRTELREANTELLRVRKILERAMQLLEENHIRMDGMEKRLDDGGM